METIRTTTLDEAMAQAGLQLPTSVDIQVGKFTRFDAPEGRKGNKAAWVRPFPDGRGAVFGDWSADAMYTWWKAHDGPSPSRADIEAFRKQAEAARKDAQAAREAAYRDAAEKARGRWDKAQTGDHPYLVHKAIRAHGCRVEGDALLVPVHDHQGAIQSLQAIQPDGQKRFLPGGKMAGGRFWIGEPGAAIVIAEPTQIQRVLLAAGMQPDSPEYQRILRESVDPRFMSPYQQQSLALQRRGQDVSAANSVRSYNSGAYSAPNQSTAGFFRVGPNGVEILSDPNTGAPLMPVTADPAVRGAVAEAEASGKERGQSLAEAQLNAPEAMASVDNMLSTIDTVLDHQGLDLAVGPYLGQKAPLVPDAIDFEARREQLQGQVFLRAYQDLKGGGAITEPEGAKAEASLGNLSRAQTPEQFRSALKSLRDVVEAARGRLKAKASTPVSGQTSTRRFNPATGRIE